MTNPHPSQALKTLIELRSKAATGEWEHHVGEFGPMRGKSYLYAHNGEGTGTYICDLHDNDEASDNANFIEAAANSLPQIAEYVKRLEDALRLVHPILQEVVEDITEDIGAYAQEGGGILEPTDTEKQTMAAFAAVHATLNQSE